MLTNSKTESNANGSRKYFCGSCLHVLSSCAEACPRCGEKAVLEYDRLSEDELSPGTLLLDERFAVGQHVAAGYTWRLYMGYDRQEKRFVELREYFPFGAALRDGSACVIPADEAKTKGFSAGYDRFLNDAAHFMKCGRFECARTIYEIFRQNGTVYTAEEYFEGITLRSLLKTCGGSLAFNAAMGVMSPLLKSLDEMHSEGMVHRMIVPYNVVITNDNRIKLLGFDCAAYYEEINRNRRLEAIFTPGYAALETYGTKYPVGPWTDVYALGAMLYLMITGQTVPDVNDRLCGEKVKPPSELGAVLPRYAEAAIMKAIDLHSRNRQQSAGELLLELEGKSAKARRR